MATTTTIKATAKITKGLSADLSQESLDAPGRSGGVWDAPQDGQRQLASAMRALQIWQRLSSGIW